jgi:hypothetical protein
MSISKLVRFGGVTRGVVFLTYFTLEKIHVLFWVKINEYLGPYALPTFQRMLYELSYMAHTCGSYGRGPTQFFCHFLG